jgi:hypothetical protein
MREERKSGRNESGNCAEKLSVTPVEIGQCYPHHYPQREEFQDVAGDALGEPMTIRQVARLLGCSIWTVRQRCLPARLPYLRISSSGKLVFYRNQVVRWILENQLKGGECK